MPSGVPNKERNGKSIRHSALEIIRRHSYLATELDGSYELTRPGITKAIYGEPEDPRVQRQNEGTTARILNQMVDEGLLDRHKAHVEGFKKRVFIYTFLSDQPPRNDMGERSVDNKVTREERRELLGQTIRLAERYANKGRFRQAIVLYQQALGALPVDVTSGDVLERERGLATAYHGALRKIFVKSTAV